MISSYIKRVGSEKNKWYCFLSLSLLFNILVHLIVGLIYYNPIDFVLQLEAAKQIADGKLLYRDIGEIIIDGNVRLPKPQYPPLYLYTLALVISIVGVSKFNWQMAKIFLVFFNIIVGILTTYIVRNYISTHPKKEILTLIILNCFLLNPISLGVVFGGYHEYFMLFFVLIAFIMFDKQKYSFSGTFFGLSVLVKPIAVIYMLPIIVWYFQQKKWKKITVFTFTGMIFFIGSLPFLLLSPETFLNDVFLIHAKRPDPSMSIYTYFFTDISMTIIPFAIQSLIIGLGLLFFLKKIPLNTSKEIILSVLPFITLFLVLNRILYPHYIPFLFPFYSINFFFLFSDLINSKKTDSNKKILMVFFIGFVLICIGDFWWAYLWSIEGYDTYSFNPLFPFSAIICILGMIVIFLISILSLYTKSHSSKEIAIWTL